MADKVGKKRRRTAPLFFTILEKAQGGVQAPPPPGRVRVNVPIH